MECLQACLKGKLMERKPISVSVLANYIKQIFDAEVLLNNIEVIGEISSFGISGGNAFFVIKDENAILNCVLFGASEFPAFKTGDKVIVRGTPKYYVKGGKLNFNATDIKLFGDGDIFKRFLELKKRLEEEGLFDASHKKPLPKKISRIGVVTSETGAVIHDIINVVSRRNANQDIVLYPIKVQGIGADAEIAKAINFFSDYDGIDAIIVGRGGGSDEDLLNFNSEIVARAVYDCKKFVISAVGHETDWTICDLVADLRAPTPSAAAELLTKDGTERKRMLELLMQNILSTMQNNIFEKNNELKFLYAKLDGAMQTYINTRNQQINQLRQNLNNLNPLKILELGYAKVECSGEQIVSKKQLNVNDDFKIYFADGKVKAIVKEIEWWTMKKILMY